MKAKQMKTRELISKTDNMIPSDDMRVLFEYVTGKDMLVAKITDSEISQAEYDKIFSMAHKVASGKPVQYVIGEWWFMGNAFYVNENVLIPRQDTETVCLAAIEHIKTLSGNVKVLDLCTGSGCIGISIAKAVKGCTVDCTDISEGALALVRRNAEYNGVAERINAYYSDMLENCSKYDVIISNPPYIPKSFISTLDDKVKHHEPLLALDGGNDGLDFYRIIAKNAKDHLNKNGSIFLEIGYDQRESVTTLLKESGYCNIKCQKDHASNDRLVYCFINGEEK